MGLRRAIITRNGSHAVDHFLAASSLQFEKIVTRDFLPCKPAGDPLLHVAETLGVDPARTVMVGDSKDDLACGRAAGAHTVLLLARGGRPSLLLCSAVTSPPPGPPPPERAQPPP